MHEFIESHRWDQFFILLAQTIANKSKDRSTKVGAVIVGPDNEVRSIGYNGFPRGVDDNIDARHERPLKYLWTEHAERNAIFNAVRAGICTKGCKLYLNWEPFPCTDCTRAIIQSGITQIIGPNIKFNSTNPDWIKNFEISKQMLEEAKIEFKIIDITSQI